MLSVLTFTGNHLHWAFPGERRTLCGREVDSRAQDLPRSAGWPECAKCRKTKGGSDDPAPDDQGVR